jgi:hypothetical protein
VVSLHVKMKKKNFKRVKSQLMRQNMYVFSSNM